MNNQNITRIQLVEGQVGFLNVKEGTNFPLNKSIGDIRDLSKRNGSFTKEITLTGDKNNNQLLNNYFDVNVQAGTFDVNKRQKCIIIQNGVVILDNAYLRLLKVEKVQSIGNESDDFVEYVVQVRDTIGDFFKEISNKELIDLRGFSQFNHTYNKENVINTFNNTVVDGYKYVLPYIDNSVFNIQELLPGIYAKQYWDKIHQQAGYSYEWADLTASTVNFDKLIVPYSGDKKKLSEEYKETVKVIAESTGSTQTNLGSGNGVGRFANIPLAKANIENEIKDDQGYYNPSTSIYVNPFATFSPDSLNYEVEIDYDLVFVNQEANPVYLQGSALNTITPRIKITNQLGEIKGENKIKLTTLNTGNTTVNNVCSLINNNETVRFASTGVLGATYNWAVGETTVGNGTLTTTIEASNIAIGDLLKVMVNASVTEGAPINVWRIASTFTAANMYAKIRVNSIKITIVPNSDNGFIVGGPVLMESLVPRKIKQSDFLKSIYQKYNLFVEVDPINPNKLIYTSRDEYYDSGAIRDLTHKLDKGQKQQLQFVPEISTKKLILSYKDDSNDALLEAYRGETSQIYGQVEITFDNENVRGLEKKEEIFSPTLNVDSPFNANLPVLAADFNYNIRLLYDGGQLNCQQYSIKEYEGSSITVSTYPFLSMVDRPENPTFDISYAQPEYYAYNIVNGTENNMYTNHWRRTLAQINSGRLLTAYFDLNEEDIANIKLNDKIKLNNALWYINAIVDYDANSSSTTKVELLSVEDDLKLPTFGTNNVKPIGKPTGVLLPRTPKPLGPTKPFVGPMKEVLAIRKIQNGVIGYTGADVQGNNAIVNSGFRGSVLGDNVRTSEDGHYVTNDIRMTTEGVFVDGTSHTRDGFSVGDTFINNSGMTYNSSYYDFGYIDEDYFDSDSISVYFTTGSTIVLDGTVNLTTIGSGTSISNLGVDASGNIVYGAGGSSTFTGGTVTGPTTFTNGVTANTFTGTFYGDGSNLTGITTDNFYTTGATLVGSTVVFDRNDTLSAYTVDLSGLEFTGQTLAQTLAIGNTTGGNDIITSNDDVIKAATGGGEINLRYVLSDNVMISTDNGQYNDESQLYMAPGFIELSNFAVGGTSQMLTNDSVSSVGGNDIRHINQYGIGGRSGFEMLATGSGTFSFGAGIRANTGQTKSYHILCVDNAITQTSPNVDILPTFISSRKATINPSIVNSVVLGGNGLIANQSNTAFVDKLNINTLGTGTSINNLGIDFNGNVVVGTDADNPFTGNTSGDCISDIYVSNIHSCSPLHINPNDEGNVYFGSTSAVTVDLTNNRLGIGTATPGEKLEVNGNITISPTTTTGQLNIGSSTHRLLRDNTSDLTLLQASSSAAQLYLSSIGDVVVAIDTNSTSSSNTFRVTKDASKIADSTELFRVQENGSVGVNDTSPNGVLTVKGSSTSSSHTIFNARNSAGTIDIFDVRGNGICYINGNSGTSQLRLRRLNAAANATKGTLSMFDASDLCVGGIQYSSGPSTDNSGQIIFRTALSSDTSSLTSIPERMRIDVDGNVGIARANPTEKLDVVGNVKISNLMKLTGIASDPGSPENGDIWHNTATNEIRVRLGGTTFKLDVTAV